MRFNRDLIWDYSLPEKPERDLFFKRWYMGRVLMRGGIRDIRSVGLKTIRRHLPHLNIPQKIRVFWEWYYKNCYRPGDLVKHRRILSAPIVTIKTKERQGEKKSVFRAHALSNGGARPPAHRKRS
jgi:hypothetical protein